MTTLVDPPRYAPGGVTAEGGHIFSWQLTPSYLTDPVILELAPEDVLPVIFVPGIMGSNLRRLDKERDPVWRLDNAGPIADKPGGLLSAMMSKGPSERQSELHPAGVEVDHEGATPKQVGGSVYDIKQYVDRGWGEVGEGSYHRFLLWLEKTLNGQGYNPATWSQFKVSELGGLPKAGEKSAIPKLAPGVRMTTHGLPKQSDAGPFELSSDALMARARFRMPVYACGYNWVDNNRAAAKRLKQRIHDVIKKNNHAHSRCAQVILITHSMGGLVARACQQLDGMQDAIAGIVHGVMPSVGAAVAYRRCKIGMFDEGGLMAKVASQVIGRNGKEVTAVFAQAPGALQLLPTKQYRPGWLTVESPSGKSLETEPSNGDPYTDIYLRDDRWWGLIRKEWLAPPGGTDMKWEDYSRNVGFAREFHDGIQNAYHPNTYVFYGKDANVPSFEGVRWQMQRGLLPDDKAPPSPDVVSKMGFAEIRDDGSNPLRVGGGKKEVMHGGGWGSAPVLDTSYWNLICAKQDGGGDGTVPISSGAFPFYNAKDVIQHQLGLPGIDHEAAYHNQTARLFVLYSLQKIAAHAKITS